MICAACGLPLPEGARFCARCGVRQRVATPMAPFWVLLLFTFGTVAAAVLAISAYGTILSPRLPVRSSEVMYVLAFAWVLFIYGAALFGVQVAALIGLGGSREWGRVAATLACLLWCLTGVGLLVAFPVLYYLWRPQPFRR